VKLPRLQGGTVNRLYALQVLLVFALLLLEIVVGYFLGVDPFDQSRLQAFSCLIVSVDAALPVFFGLFGFFGLSSIVESSSWVVTQVHSICRN
jgi:hypothetical protein